MMTRSPSATPPPSSPSPAAGPLTRRLCKGWITYDPGPGRPAEERRRCRLPVDRALTAAGITCHPMCDPGTPAAGMDDVVAAWLAGMTPEGIPGPDPWAARAAGETARAAADAASSQTRESARIAGALAELDRLAGRRVTGATLAAGRAPASRPGPDWRRWPPGTAGDAANRGGRR
jgi:hypothetical protein